jgi:hypothetical protein
MNRRKRKGEKDKQLIEQHEHPGVNSGAPEGNNINKTFLRFVFTLSLWFFF